MRTTIKIPRDIRHRHLISIPKALWEGEQLIEGDLIEVEIKKVIIKERK
jgi:hypothetical protein